MKNSLSTICFIAIIWLPTWMLSAQAISQSKASTFQLAKLSNAPEEDLLAIPPQLVTCDNLIKAIDYHADLNNLYRTTMEITLNRIIQALAGEPNKKTLNDIEDELYKALEIMDKINSSLDELNIQIKEIIPKCMSTKSTPTPVGAYSS